MSAAAPEGDEDSDSRETVSACAVRDEIARTLEVLAGAHGDGTVREMRILHAPGGAISNYFCHGEREEVAKEVAAWEDRNAPADGRQSNVYITLNPVRPELLSRRDEEYVTAASDADIERRIWFLVDFDPVRASGTSSTDSEHAAARETLEAVRGYLCSELDWPGPIVADSGNGAHALWRIDLPNDARSRDLVKTCLEALAARFSNGAVKVDTGVYNAARVVRLCGTMNRKGISTPERPHRRSVILSEPPEVGVVSEAQLTSLSAKAAAKTRVGDLGRDVGRSTVPGGGGAHRRVMLHITAGFRDAGYDPFTAAQLAFEWQFANAHKLEGFNPADPFPYDQLFAMAKGWKVNGSSDTAANAVDDAALFARIKSFADISAQPVHIIAWDIPDMLPSDEAPMILFGPPSATKSWHLKHLVDCSATGERFLGKFLVRKRPSALYINLDSGEKTFENRVQRISDAPNAHAISLRGSEFDLTILRKLLERHRGGFVVIDCLPAFYNPTPGADPARSMRVFLEAVQKAYAEFGCGGVLADHPHRPKDKEAGTLGDYYGSIQKEATSRCMWSISAVKSAGSPLVRATICSRKANEGALFADVH